MPQTDGWLFHVVIQVVIMKASNNGNKHFKQLISIIIIFAGQIIQRANIS